MTSRASPIYPDSGGPRTSPLLGMRDKLLVRRVERISFHYELAVGECDDDDDGSDDKTAHGNLLLAFIRQPVAYWYPEFRGSSGDVR